MRKEPRHPPFTFPVATAEDSNRLLRMSYMHSSSQKWPHSQRVSETRSDVDNQRRADSRPLPPSRRLARSLVRQRAAQREVGPRVVASQPKTATPSVSANSQSRLAPFKIAHLPHRITRHDKAQPAEGLGGPQQCQSVLQPAPSTAAASPLRTDQRHREVAHPGTGEAHRAPVLRALPPVVQ